MKLKKNTSYLLNFGRRQGKTTSVVSLATRNAKANHSSVSLILTTSAPLKQELCIQLLAKLDNKVERQQANNIQLKNGSKILSRNLHDNFDSFRGLSLSYIYVDNLLEITEDIKKLLLTLQSCSPNVKVIITTTTEVYNLQDFTSLFLVQDFQLIIKPVVLKESYFKNQIQDGLNHAGLKSEITLGLDYGIFK